MNQDSRNIAEAIWRLERALECANLMPGALRRNDAVSVFVSGIGITEHVEEAKRLLEVERTGEESGD